MKKIIINISYLLFFIEVLFLLSFFVLYPKSLDNKVVKVPNVLFLNKNEIKPSLKNFNIKEIYIESEKPKDVIVDIYPKVDEVIKENSLITIYLSSGNKTKMMPSFIGNYYLDVIDEIEELKALYNVKLDITYEETYLYESNYIISQTPKFNEALESSIKIVLAKSIRYIEIPDFKTKNLDIALDFFKKNNIEYEITYKDQLFIEDDVILSQSYKGKYFYKSPYKINLVVSKNKIFNFIVF